MVIGIDPNHVEAHFSLGVGYLNQGNFDEVIVNFKTTTRLNPNLTKARHGLQKAYAMQETVNSETFERWTWTDKGWEKTSK